MDSMSIPDLLFIVFGLITVVSGCFVVFARKVIVSAFSLLFTFAGVAGLYVLLGADFLAMTQLLIYVGGILILLLFAVMMTPHLMRNEIDMEKPTVPMPLALTISVLFFAVIVWTLDRAAWFVKGPRPTTPTTESIGRHLMSDYLLPFEIASILLLVALIGGVFFAREENP